MPLDLYFYGPGYGESTILHWHGDGAEGCAVVDAFLPRGGDGWTLSKLRELGVPKIDFLAATHPHLDHTKFIHYVVAEYHSRLDAVWWWGGWDRELYIKYFQTLAREDPQPDQRDRERSVNLFLIECNQRQDLGQLRLFKTSCDVREILTQSAGGSPLVEVFAISPWADPLAAFTKELANAHAARRDLGTGLNRASLGFMVNYGQAQIILGGDMEAGNWQHLRSNWNRVSGEWAEEGRYLPEIRPTLVKVSHHGSPTGCVPDMWGKDGFLVPRGRPPWAVITPWDRAPHGRRLPNEGVIETIRRSGVRVLVTAPIRKTAGVRRSASEFPHLHIRVQPNGDMQIIERGESEDMPPLT